MYANICKLEPELIFLNAYIFYPTEERGKKQRDKRKNEINAPQVSIINHPTLLSVTIILHFTEYVRANITGGTRYIINGRKRDWTD